VTVESFGGWKKAREDLFGNEGLWTKSFLKKPDANQEKKP
jgi:ABC-type sulfate transport system substrate-binding protein